MALGSTSVNVCTTCATHSLPALALRAYWKGDVACSTFLAICVAMEHATSLRTISPTTTPSGLRNTVRRPNLNHSRTSVWMFAVAKSDPTWQNRSESWSDSKSGKKWSEVIPGATPRLGVRRHNRNSEGSNSNGVTGLPLLQHGSLGTGGLRSQSVNALNVVRSPGANCAPSNACRAADNSPNCANRKARDALSRTSSGAFSCALHLIYALELHSLDPRRVIGSILPLGNVGTCSLAVCVGCDLHDEDGSTTSLAAT